jgi:hypothetical protein
MDVPALASSVGLRLRDVFVGDVGEVGEVGTDVLPSFLPLPTKSADSLKDPAVSTFFTGRIVSTPVPKSASRIKVPRMSLRSAYDDRRPERMEPVYAGGAPKGEEPPDDCGGVAGPVLSSAEELISADGSSDGTSCSSISTGTGLMTIVECAACKFNPIAARVGIGSLPLVAALVSTDACPSSSNTDPSSST